MKQEDKELLLRDLCARLPYRTKCKYYNVYSGEYEEGTIKGFEREEYIQVDGTCVNIENIKPYLFPLSSMTEEQKEELYIVTNGKFNAGYKYIDNCKPRNWSEWGTTEYNWIRHYDIDLLHTWLNKNHFDFRGLIEKGLANDCTNLNIY